MADLKAARLSLLPWELHCLHTLGAIGTQQPLVTPVARSRQDLHAGVH
jgi:hypothetical protein